MFLRIAFLLIALAVGSAPVQAQVPVYAASPGDALFAAADFDGAERAYRAALAADPRDAAAELGLARIAIYRNDLDGAERHARALAADHPDDARARRILAAVGERRGDGPDYRVTLTGTQADVPLVRMDPLPEVDASVNGKPARLVLDTGGSGLDLSAAFVKALGITTQSGGEGVFAGGLRATVSTAHVDRLDLRGATIRSLPVNVTERLLPGVDGVIGTRVFYQFLSTIDYVHRRLVLRPKDASDVFESAARARGAAIVPMLLVPDHFIFARAHVNAAPEALFNIDTGGSGVGVQLTKAALASAAIVPDSAHPTTFEGGGGTTRILPFTADVTLGGRTVSHVPGVYFPEGDQYGIFPFAVAGTISQDAFRRGALTFDFAAMTLVFEVS